MDLSKTTTDLKEEALKALKGEYLEALFISIVVALLSTPMLAFYFIPANIKDKKLSDLLPFEVPHEFVGPVIVLIFVAIIGFCLVSVIVSTGYAKYNLDLINSGSPSMGVIFKYFKYGKKSIVAYFYVFIIVFLGTLLFVIPGIIAAFSYAMVPYILAENPDLAPEKALELSKDMMKGNKSNYLWLLLSFIGWIILCAFTYGIGFIFLAPYIYATNACFYREISKRYEEDLNRNKSNNKNLNEEDILYSKKNNEEVNYFSDDKFI